MSESSILARSRDHQRHVEALGLQRQEVRNAEARFQLELKSLESARELELIALKRARLQALIDVSKTITSGVLGCALVWGVTQGITPWVLGLILVLMIDLKKIKNKC